MRQEGCGDAREGVPGSCGEELCSGTASKVSLGELEAVNAGDPVYALF